MHHSMSTELLPTCSLLTMVHTGETDAAMNDWGRIQGFAIRDRSILTEFFPTVTSQERVDDIHIIAERIMASSTAASVASSSSSKGGDEDSEAVDKELADDETVDKELETAFDPLSPVAASLDLTGTDNRS
jgi:hypothetical protein